MPESLLTTKLYFPPLRMGIIPRPVLVERLARGLAGPLTIVSAPAGYGKSTLLGAWRAGPGADCAAAWLALDEGDNDPARFFHHLIAALDLIQPGLAPKLLPLLKIPEYLSSNAILTPLINVLDALPEFVLILDDVHVIEAGAIQTALTFLIDHLPPRMHLALLTRADPPLPLARLRARGQLV